MKSLDQALAEGRSMLADGGIGTQFLSAGVSARDMPLLALTDPEAVLNLHLEYLRAGARIIETHTFMANRSKLEAMGIEADVYQINRKAAQLARHARDIFGEEVYILGSLGPLAAPVDAPLLPGVDAPEAEATYREAVAALIAGGVDGFIVETMSDLGTVRAAVAAIRKESVLPFVVTFAFSREGTTLYGLTPEEAALGVADLAPLLVGANCGTGPSPLLDAILRMAPITNRLGIGLAAYPNAGEPQLSAFGKIGYRATPEYMAHLAPALRDAGCRVIGGCCGVGPAHIAKLAQALFQSGARDDTAALSWRVAAVEEREPERPLLEGGGGVKVTDVVEAGRFVISVELDPPRGVNAARILDAAETVIAAGADFINVGDSPMARVRLSALGTSRLIQERVHAGTILHFTTRDRNLMGLQSDLLGAFSLGLKNVLCLTGDPPGLGDYAHATAVYDLDSIGLAKVLQGFNAGHDAVGLKIGAPTDFCIGVGLNPNAESLPEEVDRIRRKLEAGAMFVMTQPVYEASQIFRFLDAFGPMPLPMLVGIMPLVSHRQAQYLHNEVPGITIPNEVMVRMEGQDSPEKGTELAMEFLDRVISVVQGMYLVPSFNRVDPLLPVIHHVRAYSRGN